jgi:hypothetical protein
MNVSTRAIEVTDPSGSKVLKRILVADKDFTAGAVIYDVTLPLAALTFWVVSSMKTGATDRIGSGPGPRRKGTVLFSMSPPNRRRCCYKTQERQALVGVLLKRM